MDSKVINFGDQRQEFVLAIEPTLGLPAWCTMKDELWLTMVSNSIYEYFNTHPLLVLNKSITSKNEYAFEVSLDSFKNTILSGEALRYKDTIFELVNVLSQPSRPNAIYITYFSDATDHYINCMIEGSTIKLGSCLTDQVILL